MPARIDDILVLDTAASKTGLAKYLRDREAVLPNDFGGLGDGADDANLNRRMKLRFAAGVAFAQIGVVGFDGPIELEALRLYGLPEAAPAVLNNTPAIPNAGRLIFSVETDVDLPNLAPGAEHLFDVTLTGVRPGDLCSASLATSSRFVQVAGHVWSNNTVRVVARNVSGFNVDLPSITLAVEVRKRRLP